jgi:glutamate/tyrosine decarboxylase-like PLP-dependent enzyme
MLITRHKEILNKTFRIITDYMPKEAETYEVIDQYSHSIQWSRRFSGLKLYLSMMIFGWIGYSEVILQQVEMGNLLKKLLVENSWIVMNDTPLPIACFTDKIYKSDIFFAKRLCESALTSGKAWISTYPINGIDTIRTCITNYNTNQNDILDFISLINKYRSEYISGY